MNAIPYTVERRPDTGVNNVQLGIWLFLASEVMLFGGLFSAYFTLRAGASGPWGPLRDHLVPAVIGTLSLFLATAFVTAANGARRYRGSLAIAILGALAFCALKVTDYQTLIASQRGPSTSTQMATFFLLTGVHLLHVLGGVLANVWIAIRSGASPDLAVLQNRLRAAAMYWYFVDGVWLMIFVLVYVA